MKTNRKLSIVSLLALGVLAAGFSAKPATAQELEGRFTLPSAARWGFATLPAGDYSFTLDQFAARRGVIQVYRGERTVAFVMPLAFGDRTSDRSEMTLVSGAVRELNMPQIGTSLRFSDHNLRHRRAPKEIELAQAIPVTAVGAAGR